MHAKGVTQATDGRMDKSANEWERERERGEWSFRNDA